MNDEAVIHECTLLRARAKMDDAKKLLVHYIRELDRQNKLIAAPLWRELRRYGDWYSDQIDCFRSFHQRVLQRIATADVRSEDVITICSSLTAANASLIDLWTFAAAIGSRREHPSIRFCWLELRPLLLKAKCYQLYGHILPTLSVLVVHLTKVFESVGPASTVFVPRSGDTMFWHSTAALTVASYYVSLLAAGRDVDSSQLVDALEHAIPLLRYCTADLAYCAGHPRREHLNWLSAMGTDVPDSQALYRAIEAAI